MALGHFDLLDADGKVVRRIPVPENVSKGMARIRFEQETRARCGVDDATLFLRDSRLDAAP